MAWQPFARWVCPGSVGYSCDPSDGASGTIGSPLLFQPEPDVAPCAVQNSGVRWVTALFMFGIPGVCGLLAIFPIRRAVITSEQHAAILAAIAVLKRDPSAHVVDPLTGGPLKRQAETTESMHSEQFSAWERMLAQPDPRRLSAYLGGRLALYSAVIIGFTIATAVAYSDSLLQVFLWVLAFLIVLVPFDGLRLAASLKSDVKVA